MDAEMAVEINPSHLTFGNAQDEMEMKIVLRELVEFASALVVDSDVSYKKITNIYSDARGWKKVIEDKRKELVDPFRKQIASVNDRAKALTDPLDYIIHMANVKAGEYVVKLENERLEEEKRTRAAVELFSPGESVYVPPLNNAPIGAAAVLQTKIEKTFLLVDIAKVPLKYLMIDEEAVRRDIKLGVNEIPGLTIQEEKITSLRRR